MVENHNPDNNESKPLTTETEVLAPEATADHTGLSSESTSTQPQETAREASSAAAQHAPPAATARASADHGTVATVTAAAGDESEDDLNYDAADFAAALANFDREQAAESAAAQNLTVEEVIVTGTVVKVTDKHVVVDIGLKSEGLIPLEQVLDIHGVSKFQTGDSVEVVVEREEPEGGYLVSYEKALRHKVWDKLEQAANDKTPVKGMVLGRVKGGLTVDIGIKAFLPGSQVEVRPVRNLDGYIGTEIQVRVIKLNKKRGNVVISRKELLEEDQNAKKSITLATLEEGSVLTG
ncbi:MAG TPA: S1 RNA-binding domain-containing protein, partial [Edaphobacter sp.]|nr:S1 RNA-binding domain-containing protein [Edaphobacter sp.]